MPPKGKTSKKAKAEAAPLTTAQSLGSSIKSARDIMRKDKGLNGDLDRLPLLTWIMFLKFLDDLEQQRAAGSEARRQAVPAGDRGAVPLAGLGRECRRASPAMSCLTFINQDETTRPDGTQGPGPVRLPARPHQRQRRRPPRRDRDRVQGRR